MSHEALPKVPFEELLQRARARDARAFNELLEHSQRKLKKWTSRRRASALPGGARPSDIGQDVVLRAFREFHQFKGSTEREWFGWLKQIYRNYLAQSHRHAHREKREPPGILPLDSIEAVKAPSPEKSPSQFTVRREEWHRLFACIYSLPDDWKEAIVLCHLQELSLAEAARLMERTEKSVAGLLLRGWQQVRTRMRAELGPEAVAAPDPPPLSEEETALLAYLRRCSSGERVDPTAFIAEHPTCADELRDMLHWIERLQALRPTPPKK
jgi:RNA polymerase sigma-70 factor (ECF subfamily)